MADTNLSTIAGGARHVKLAPDLDRPSRISSVNTYETTTAINTSGSLTEVLNLVGRYAISYVALSNMIAESITIKLTIDGVIIYNDSFVATSTAHLLIGEGSTGSKDQIIIQCDESFLLEVQTATDTSIDVLWTARKIL